MGESVSISMKKSEAAKEDRTSQIRKSNYSQPVNSSVDRILFLQRTIGNQTFGRLIKSGAFQAKLKIGQPGNMYEQEADTFQKGKCLGFTSDSMYLQRTIGDDHDLTSPRFKGDPDLEACYDNERLLVSGSSRGEGVRKVQAALIDAGYPLPKYGADGKFGNETKTAVKMFQSASGFRGKDVDGKIGPKTMYLLDTQLGGTPSRWAEYLTEGLSKLSSLTREENFILPWTFDERYWEVDDSDSTIRKAYKLKSGVAPSEAVDKLFQNLNMWRFDCAMFPEIAHLYAYLHALGDTDFDIQFKDLRLRTSKTTGITRKIFDVNDIGEEMFNQIWNNSPIGTKVLWTNRSPATINTSWNNENAIKSFKGTNWQDDRYDAHPLGRNLLEEEVKRRLAEYAKDYPNNGTELEKDTYIGINIYRSQMALIIFS